jgi:hypothetical protein
MRCSRGLEGERLIIVVPVENDHQEDEDDDEYADDGEVSRA